MPELVSLLPLVAIALLFWLLLIRPNARRQKELARMQSSLKAGDEVMLTSGIFGLLRDVDDDTIQLQIADGVVVKVARGAVGSLTSLDQAPHDQHTLDPDGLASGEPEEN